MDFSEKIDAFAKGIEDFLSSGAYVVESKILDSVYSGGAEVESFNGRDFASQLKLAMNRA